jgi:uncharacterized membrane protein (UPF0182 family)
VARVVIPEPRRRWPIWAAGTVVAALIVLSVLSGFVIDLLWFREVGFSSVFWTILRTEVGLGVGFGLLFFALLYVNLLIVRWLAPRYRVLSREEELIERYRTAFEPHLWWILPSFAAVLALFVGIGAAPQWRTFLLWRNAAGVTFGSPIPPGDPIFHRDPAFYVFTLPWLRFVQGWLFSALVGVLVISAVGHYLWGGIRPNAIGEKVTPQVKAHLSVLLGLIVLVKAWGYQLGQFDLLTSPRGVVAGASYTDVKAQLPALRLLVVIAVVCALLFLVNIWRRGWALPVVGIGLLAMVSIIVGAAIPAGVQRFSVAPQEQQRERPYIRYNIAFTRRAFGLDRIAVQERDVATSVTPEEIEGNRVTIENIRLWRPEVLRENFQTLQRIRQYYEFHDVDVDRYVLGGERRVVMVAAREVSQDGIPAGGQTWQNRHLVYTHGFGAVVAQVNTATPEGAPLFTLRDIPPAGEPALTQPRIYYGEGRDVPFVVVGTRSPELDYEGAPGGGERRFSYDGEGGIEVGGFFRRLLFAWRYRDVNLLISGLIRPDSRIMIYRDIRERATKAAPFLRFDGDPYAAIVDGRIVWIWDAYTTTTSYPYSQPVDIDDVVGNDEPFELRGNANYIRNSVKVVIDAYDGTMTYYVADPEDPIVQVWRRAFPDLFTDLSEASPELRAHFRYPEDLFRVQAAQFANYHVTNPDEFYRKQDFWAIPPDPTIPANAPEPPPGQPGPSGPLRPYYVLMRLPGGTEEEFVLILPFVPEGRQNMVAWMAARSDPERYGELVAYQFPTGRNVDGPTQVFAEMRQDPRFSAQQTLLGQVGSRVLFGDFLPIPLGRSILYVQPVYVRSEQEAAIPQLKFVLAASGGGVGLGSTLAQAVSDAVGAAVPEPGEEGPPPEGTVAERIAELLGRAAAHFQAADEALRAGDLATYQREIEAARAAVEQARELAGEGAAEAAPTPSP